MIWVILLTWKIEENRKGAVDDDVNDWKASDGNGAMIELTHWAMIEHSLNLRLERV